MALWASHTFALILHPDTLLSSPQPILDESTVLSLGEPRFHVTLLPCPPSPLPPSSSRAVATVPLHTTARHGGGEDGSEDHPEEEEEDRHLEEAVAAAAAFRRVAMQAAAATGGPLASCGGGGGNADEAEGSSQQPPQPHGPFRPFLAPVLTNRRITREDHFQDVR